MNDTKKSKESLLRCTENIKSFVHLSVHSRSLQKWGSKYSPIHLKVQELLLKKSEDGFSAQLQSGEWRIYYNDAKNYGRINNTLMHEIGHIVLDHSEDSDLAESEVKFFAKYALAPPVLIYKLRLTSSAEIEDNFQISHEAAQYAYNYYQKWLAYGSIYLTDYEMTMLELFDQAS